jgi:hypothetical protein
MRSNEFAGAGGAAGDVNFELNRHFGGFYKDCRDCRGQRSDCRSKTETALIAFSSAIKPSNL